MFALRHCKDLKTTSKKLGVVLIINDCINIHKIKYLQIITLKTKILL